MKRKILLVLSITAILLSGCSLLADAPAPTEAPTAVPTETPAPNPLAGLIFSNGEGLWQVTLDGHATNLATCAQGNQLSPDGSQMAYTGDDFDVYLLTLATCEISNLTNTPDNIELNPQWWPARAGAILIGVDPEFSAGKPALIQLGTPGYTILENSASPAELPALGPNGVNIAFTIPGSPAILNVEKGLVNFDFSAYGLNAARVQRVESPSWSPDGRKLAWIVGTQDGEDYATWRISVAIFDLVNRTYILIHPYIPVGRSGWPPAVSWSPDGKWIAFNAWAEDPASESGIWVAASDGSEEHYLSMPNPNNTVLDQRRSPIWSPDSRYVAISMANTDPLNYFAEVGIWEAIPLPLPDDIELVDWRSPQE